MITATVQCLHPQGFHRMSYRQYGDPANDQVLVCVHGLARNAGDFDDIARALSAHYRVICPDVAGRGQSDWLPSAQHYQIPQYLNDMTTLLARLNVEKVDWLGTSMGGIIGMLMAALPNSPIRKLVLNDIGPFVAKEALSRIGSYLKPVYLPDLTAAQAQLRTTYPGLTGLSDAQWQRLTRDGFHQTEQGWTQHYDPAIGEMARQSAGQDVDLWAMWRAIRCPQLLIWGEDSDILSRETVTQMQQENPAMALYTLPKTPHVPSLMVPDQIARVSQWLLSESEATL